MLLRLRHPQPYLHDADRNYPEGMTTASRHASIEKATAIAWDAWVEYLDAQGGREATHKQVVSRARSHMPPHVTNARWWAQSVAVAYFHHLGRREPGQRQDGTLEVCVSRTLPGTLDETLQRWLAFVDERDTFADSPMAQESTVSATSTWRRWRTRLEDGTRVTVDIGTRRGTSVLTVTHARLSSKDQLEQHRTWWKEMLADL
jgi:hypothetical protein